MVKEKTEAGRKTWAFVCRIVCRSLPPGATKTQIISVAYITFQVGDDFPPHRVDEAAQERCGWPTKAAFEQRAKELGLLLPSPDYFRRQDARETHNEKVADINRLHALAAPRRHTGTEAGMRDAEAIEMIIRQAMGERG